MTLKDSLPSHLIMQLNALNGIKCARPDTAALSTALIDHTSLQDGHQPMTGAEQPTEIQDHCKAAVRAGVAAVCVYPNQAPTAARALTGSKVALAVVNNFPHGSQTAEEASAQVTHAANCGATEIDTVLDYQAWLQGDNDLARDKLLAVSTACKTHNLKLKTILKASLYKNYDDLYAVAQLACETGADFVKSCTGKLAERGYGDIPDSSTPETAITIMQAVADFNQANGTEIGIKISGGVKNALDCEKYRTLIDSLFGVNYFAPETFRFGASSLLSALDGRKGTSSSDY